MLTIKNVPPALVSDIRDALSIAKHQARMSGMSHRRNRWMAVEKSLDEVLTQSRQSAPAIYTCKGKGGRYELLGHSAGAGSRAMEQIAIYRDVSTGVTYHRTLLDFQERMEVVE